MDFATSLLMFTNEMFVRFDVYHIAIDLLMMFTEPPNI